ncbi:MAG TPA: glycogen/starch/alpha-glucan phosphorylase [Steroidobacteraceae bacterium]|nr:glycogen/starch/alpha-glucan phosphorylase [Steroidobacteraceae bacterium]
MNEPTLVSGAILRRGSLRAAIYDRLTRSLGKEPETATPRDIYDALSLAVREELSARWLATQRRVARARVKRLCYLSVEFLPGRSLLNALSSLDSELIDEARVAVASMGHDFDAVIALEVDPGLGNGGLGRLAACFLDSLATLQYPATGYGIRYDYGIFTQSIDTDGAQRESASTWLRLHNVWETPRSDARYIVRFGGRVLNTQDAGGVHRSRWVETRDILAVGFDQLVPGNRSPTVNHLRLWSGRALQPFHIEDFNAGNYPDAVEDQIDAKNLSRVLYPDDSTPQGKELRFKQQYFFVSASIQDILATHLGEERALEDLPVALAVQMNDTHPTLAIPELMRLLVDQYDMPWADAWAICRSVFGYTNHTLMPEALETWPVNFFERLLPRHLEIIYRINEEFLLEVEKKFKGDDAAKTMLSIIAENHGRRVRMSHLAVVGSHKVNGVARLHSDLMKKTIFSGFARMYPERFTNVTNGITVRRWLKQSNPLLSRLLTERLGSAWENDLEEIERLRWAADDPHFRKQFRDIKRVNKLALAEEVDRRTGIDVSVDSLFDVHVKRIHEYKRQLLNILYVITRYNRIKARPDDHWVPRTVMFAGKAAPGYVLAKAIIRLINNVSTTINQDPLTLTKLKCVFLPDYDVSLAQTIMPAADLSQQISTAGMEASGTGNMKLTLNGALTIGTLDGANIEIRDSVGPDNIFIFGMTADEAAQRQADGYRPREIVAANAELAATLDMIRGGAFSRGGSDDARLLVDRLTSDGEPFLVLADFVAYCEAQDRVDALYRQPEEWSRRAVLNTVGMGPFSSDRSVREYAERIWNIRSVI